MLVRCPQCDTRFRLRPEQLQAADGNVRCGLCDRVFNAREQLRGPPAPSPQAPVIESALPDESGPSPWSTLLWSLGVVLLVALAVAQTVWWERSALSADPDGFKAVQWLCRFAPCEATPPKSVDHIQVVDRIFEPDPDAPGALRFDLRIVNTATMPQPYPVIELRLFDARERMAAAGRFAPEDYLSDPPRARLLEPSEPLAIRLRLEDPGDHVVGFQIDLL